MNIQEYYLEEYYEEKSKFSFYKNSSHNNKALFLDRDGVLIEDSHYIDCPSKVCLCKNSIPFLNYAYINKYDLIILTNQSSVSRKIITYQKYVEITEAILSKLPLKLYPKYILASFHLPDNSNNLENFNWRKPGTGMFENILVQENYDISKSIMIGDKISDLLPAFEIGIENLIYIQSKSHKNEILKIEEWNKKNLNRIKIIKKLEPKYLSIY